MSEITTHLPGYPRIGARRELKKATEAYWSGKSTIAELEETGRRIRRENREKQRAAGIDLVPVNDFSFYDHVLDLSCLLGNIPARFGWDGGPVSHDLRFRIARGVSDGCCGSHEAGFAGEMTKWFDTNYHYIVPEFHEGTRFRVSDSKIFDEFREASEAGFTAKPVLIGPVTYLTLGKVRGAEDDSFDRFTLLEDLLAAYEEILARLAAAGAEWIQIDEPVFALDLSATQRNALAESLPRLARAAGDAKLLLASYFGGLRENVTLFLSAPAAAFHIDAVRGAEDLDAVLAGFPAGKILSLGIIDGRNVWKNHFDSSLEIIGKASAALGADRLWLAPSCSLLHSPVSLAEETIDPEVRDWLAFSDEKLAELEILRQLASGTGGEAELAANRASHQRRSASSRIHNPAVSKRLAGISDADTQRKSAFSERRKLQQQRLSLPLFPTTTIGSFPQTNEVRKARAAWKNGKTDAATYDAFLKEETRRCVEWQETIGIDVLVHGEFERNDMVEYFGEQLDGFVFSANGWVQSYGSRCVKPPIIFGDVSRPRPMTVDWTAYAQSLTTKPVKGMLTGPVTILQWSFVRDDQPRATTADQIALAIRDEAVDLEMAGISVIQIDEPAIREGLPLRRGDWQAYLRRAVGSFRLSAAGVRDDTQIHTHMCYSEFNDIMAAIAALDADVITIETSRSAMELLDAFVGFSYPNDIGPGVYDIHSPRIPATVEMESLMQKAAAVIPAEQLWVNPDCGLKTRGWAEVRPALERMVAAARSLRENALATAG